MGEAICEAAHRTTRLNGRMHVLRIGQLCGDTKGGIWNVTEAWPLMLSSVSVTGTLPNLEEVSFGTSLSVLTFMSFLHPSLDNDFDLILLTILIVVVMAPSRHRRQSSTRNRGAWIRRINAILYSQW